MTSGPETVLSDLEQRLRADGCDVNTASLRGGPALVGRRSDFKVSWFLTNATPLPHVTLAAIQDYTQAAVQHAKEAKGGLPRGFQTGVAVFPVLVGEQVDPDAAAWAAEKQRLEFACMTRPVVVDAGTGQAHAFRGKARLGGVYNRHLVGKLATYLP
jgi:hypothetical protein